MSDIDFIRREIEHMCVRVGRHRKEMHQLQPGGNPTASAEALLERMLAKIDNVCAERDRLKAEQSAVRPREVLGGRRR
jgi:hypothetical protein